MALQPIGEILDRYVHYIAEQCLTIVDAIFGVENDNENEPFPFPASINADCYAIFQIYQVTPYNTMGYQYGRGGKLYEYNVTYMNGEISVSGFSPVGRTDQAKWSFSGSAAGQEDAVDAEMDAFVSGTANFCYVAKTFPDRGFSYQLTAPSTNSNRVVFGQYNDGNIFDNGAADCTCTLYSGVSQVNYSGIDIIVKNIVESPPGYYENTGVGSLPSSGFKCPYKKGLVITSSDNDTQINNYITKNGATNNYTTTYTTEAGDTVTVYYGDNYIITKNDPDIQVSYNEVKNMLDPVINQINQDLGTDIKFPGYKDLKPMPPTDDDYIDMGLGVETDGMAMYNMAVLTRDDLIQLITDFETNADTGLSFLPHVLGLYKLGIESSQLLTTNSDTINLHKEPGKTAFISTDNYDIVDTQLQVIDCGSITVDRELLLTNTFLDYSPYSSYEMFIPGCGWITLPDTVVGRTISVHIVFDLTTCSCKGVVRSEGELLGGSGSTLATVNGIIGSSVPLSINETGLQRGAIMSGDVQTVTALGTTAMGIGIGNPYIGMSGIVMAAGSLADTHIAGNATYTSTKGGATDYSVFGDGYKAVLKITRPVLDIPDNYGHTVGYVVNKYDTLGNYSGFTVCLNPHITGLTCTSDEKEEIARLLERGVILPSGE